MFTLNRTVGRVKCLWVWICFILFFYMHKGYLRLLFRKNDNQLYNYSRSHSEIYVHQLIVDLNFQNEDLDGNKLPLACSVTIKWAQFLESPSLLGYSPSMPSLHFFKIQNAEACLVLNLPVPIFYPVHFPIYVSKTTPAGELASCQVHTFHTHRGRCSFSTPWETEPWFSVVELHFTDSLL